MQYRQLGSSQLQVSEIALGSWLTYGAAVGRRDAEACLARAFAEGINFIDTANVYGRGAAEQLLGELLAPYPRDSYILATKVYFPMSPADSGLSSAQIDKQLTASLKRLRTDYVDLYQCHRYDFDTPLEETMQALTRAVESGKVRHIGFSEWPADKIRAAAAMSGVTRFVSSQPQYSMLARWPEKDVIPLCRELGISQVVFSPLAQGVLTGKYRPGVSPGADTRAGNPRMNAFIGNWTRREVLTAVQGLAPIADAAGLSVPRLALAWVLANDNVASAIIGATRPEQVSENAAAAGVRLDDDTLARIDACLGSVIQR